MLTVDEDADERDDGRNEKSWNAAANSTLPADRIAAENGVLRLYRSLGHDRPKQIRWATGPLELAADREKSWLFDDVGTNLAGRLSDKLAHASYSYSHDVKRHPLFKRRIGHIASSNVQHSTLMAITDRQTSGVRVGHRLRRLVAPLRGRGRPEPWCTMGIGGRSQLDAAYVGCERYLYSRFGLVAGVGEFLDALWTVVSNTGWIVPHERVCWLCERPRILRLDARGRLHCDMGPALAYADGFETFAWKGISVPRWIIETPEAITVRRIRSQIDPFIRRCMIEVMTPARFTAEGGASVQSCDETGVLWAAQFGFDMWAAVEVVNGTPEPDGHRKHYFLQVPPEMRTARQAVAWTYHLQESEYEKLAVRT